MDCFLHFCTEYRVLSIVNIELGCTLTWNYYLLINNFINFQSITPTNQNKDRPNASNLVFFKLSLNLSKTTFLWPDH